MDHGTHRKNRIMLASLIGLVAGMIALSFAAVPLYSLFCQVTGFGGTTQRAEAAPERIVDRTITIRFNADVNQGLPWSFKPEIHAMQVKVGQQGMTSYRASNASDQPVTGTAVYNVTPEKAGIYFNKIQCFCFDEQTLAAGQTVDMPVLFFVDPAMADDPALNDVDTITLSYTFFRAKSEALDGAINSYYQGAEQAVSPTAPSTAVN